MTRQRLDKALQQRGLAPSRTRAAQLIEAGAVRVDGVTASKAAAQVSPDQKIVVNAENQWVSRAAHKLLGALEAFPSVTVTGRRCLDAGASTGGFTQVLLHHGAAHVVAVDVGRDQLAPALRNDPRVTSKEGLNLRYADLQEHFALIVADLSFISLTLVMDRLAIHAAPDADLVLMVKPQFEVGRHQLARTGVVSSPPHRRKAVEKVIEAAAASGLTTLNVARSPLAGQDGNAEFFLHLTPHRATIHNIPGTAALNDRLGETPAQPATAHQGQGHTVDLDEVNFDEPQ